MKFFVKINIRSLQFFESKVRKIVLKKKFFFNIYLFFERQRAQAWEGGAERVGDTESETGSWL